MLCSGSCQWCESSVKVRHPPGISSDFSPTLCMGHPHACVCPELVEWSCTLCEQAEDEAALVGPCHSLRTCIDKLGSHWSYTHLQWPEPSLRPLGLSLHPNQIFSLGLSAEVLCTSNQPPPCTPPGIHLRLGCAVRWPGPSGDLSLCPAPAGWLLCPLLSP